MEPWTPRPGELTGPTYDYGPAFVEQRDREVADRRRRHTVGVFLVLVLPLVGLLGSETKRRIEKRYAIGAVAATRASLYVEGVIMLAAATLLLVGREAESRDLAHAAFPEQGSDVVVPEARAAANPTTESRVRPIIS